MKTLPKAQTDFDGRAEVEKWFGYWPSFHDAEVVAVALQRTGWSEIKVHAWHTSNEVDEKGHFKTSRHALVTFLFSGLGEMELKGFNHQNVVFEIDISKENDLFRFVMQPCFGIVGFIESKELSVTIGPWKAQTG